MAVGIGLELGGTVLRVAAIESRGGSLNLLAWQEIPCDTNSPEALTQSLTRLRQALPRHGRVVLGLPSGSVLLATVAPLIVNAARSALAVEFELQQTLPFGLEEAAWHYQWLNGLPTREIQVGTDRKALVAAVKRSRLEERLASCRRAGLSVSAVAVNSLAALNTWHRDLGAAAPERALFLHLSDQTAEWILCSPSQLHVLPLATDPSSASLEDLMGDISRSLEALRALPGEGEGRERRVWLLGAYPQLGEIGQRLSSALGLQVGAFELRQRIGMEAVRVESVERSVIALGLALQGLGTAPLRINLISEAQAAARHQAIQRVAWASGGVCAAVALGLALSGMAALRQRQSHALSVFEQREQDYLTLRPEIRLLLKEQVQIEQRATQFRTLVADRGRLGVLSVSLAAAMPDDLWLTKLDLTKRGRIYGLIEGRARSFQSVTQFIERIKRIEGVTTVRPLTTKVLTDEASGREVVAFSLVIQGSFDDEDSMESAEFSADTRSARR